MDGEKRYDQQYIRTLMRTFTHDLRNPLVNMQALMLQLQEAAAELRHHAVGDEAMAELDDSLALMGETVERMNRLIQGVYGLAQVLCSEPHCAWVPLAPVVAEEAEGRQSLLARKGIRLQTEALPELWADAEALHRIVAELLDNAIRFAPDRGGEIICRVEQRDGMDCLIVQDNGEGVAAALRERIFEPFYASDPAREGEGLAMVQALAQRHGGRAWCEAAPQGGGLFCIALPHPG